MADPMAMMLADPLAYAKDETLAIVWADLMDIPTVMMMVETMDDPLDMPLVHRTAIEKDEMLATLLADPMEDLTAMTSDDHWGMPWAVRMEYASEIPLADQKDNTMGDRMALQLGPSLADP